MIVGVKLGVGVGGTGVEVGLGVVVGVGGRLVFVNVGAGVNVEVGVGSYKNGRIPEIAWQEIDVRINRVKMKIMDRRDMWKSSLFIKDEMGGN